MKFPILENDNCKTIAQRLARTERNVKDARKVKLLRFEDPVLGPRKRPSAENIGAGKIEITEQLLFKLDLESKMVKMQNIKTSEITDLGEAIVYRV